MGRHQNKIDPDGLTPRQRVFVEAYLVNPNGTNAAIVAGCSERCASASASDWLRHPKVMAVLTKRTAAVVEKVKDKYEVTQERTLREIAKLAYSNMHDYVSVTTAGQPVVDFCKLDEDGFAAVAQVETETYTEKTGDRDAEGNPIEDTVRRTKFKLHDKARALEMLGRYHKMFTDKIEATGKDGGPIVVAGARELLTKKLLGRTG
jgi:phage terminase small subunit